MEQLTLIKRDKEACHSARKERAKGMVPGVIYGKEIENTLFDIDAIELKKELCASGEHGVVNFKLGDKQGTAVIKEVQKSPVAHKVIHIDLEEVADNYKIHTEVAIKILGKGLLESQGLILQTQRDLVKVVCTSKDLPKEIELDVSDAKAGTVYTFKDLNMSGKVEIDEDITGVIGSVIEESREEEEDGEETTEI